MNQQLSTLTTKGDQPTEQESQTFEEVREVNSLAEYLNWINECCPDGPAHEYTLFYRGHSDFSYKLEPSACRFDAEGKSFRSVEHHLYSEMLRHSPSDFSGDKEVFERLVRMQHYGLPTRLLDLTLSPLVGLYFSCCEKNNVAGEVILFSRRNNEFCYSSGIWDSAFVGIEESVDVLYISSQILSFLIDYLDSKKNIFSVGNNFDQELTEFFCKEIDIFRQGKENSNDIFLFSSLILRFENEMKSIFEKKIEFLKNVCRNANVDLYEKNIALDKQLRMVKFEEDFYNFTIETIEKFSSALKIKINQIKSLSKFILQFTHYVFVLPTINNERIRRQQGAFLLFPPIISSHWKAENFVPIAKRVRINASAKEKIIKELLALGMSESYIFPELDKLAKDVKLRHPAR